MTTQATPTPNPASFDAAAMAVVITGLTITDPSVVAEARRWSEGRRGAAVPAETMDGADLSAFVSHTIAVGSQAVALAGGAQDTFELERLIHEVTTRTAESSAQAAEATSSAVKAAAQSVTKATDDVRKVIAEAGTATRTAYEHTVATTTAALRGDVERIFGGDNPELLAKLTPVLESVGRKIGDQAFKQTDELLVKVSRQFDPADPTSPFAKQAKTLADQQQTLAASIDKQHLALVGKVDELAKAVEVQKAARDGAARTAQVTTLKGGTYEDAVNRVMDEIAAGLGDEYSDTSKLAGTIQRCFKGDGVLTVDGGVARVLVEMHDARQPRAWHDYLATAELNREAAASIGLVPTVEQNGGQTIRALGARRVVMAFDPALDDSSLLRTVVQLMRVSAIAASTRRDVDDLATAEEHLHEAEVLLERINTIRKASHSIRTGADKIDKECNAVQSGVGGHLSQALDALSAVGQIAGDESTLAQNAAPGAA